MRRSNPHGARLCFRCGYTLPNDPDETTCPECGLANRRIEADAPPAWITPLCVALAALVPFAYLIWWFSDQGDQLFYRMGLRLAALSGAAGVALALAVHRATVRRLNRAAYGVSNPQGRDYSPDVGDLLIYAAAAAPSVLLSLYWINDMIRSTRY